MAAKHTGDVPSERSNTAYEPSSQGYVNPYESYPKRKGKAGKIIAGLLIALVLAGAAAGAYFFFNPPWYKVTVNGERPLIVVAFFSTFSCIILIPFIIFTYQPITPLQLFYCIMTGVAACFGQIFISSAYAMCPAKEISIYDYSTVIFTALLGLIVLGEIPDWLSILGYAIIIGASVLNYLYNNNFIKIGKKKSTPTNS